MHIVKVFFDSWLAFYANPIYILIDNGTQLVKKFFAKMCAFHKVKHLKATACHTKTNGQAERFNIPSLCPFYTTSPSIKRLV